MMTRTKRTIAQRTRPILGVATDITSPRLRRAIARVFRAIQKHPKDWARLRRRVRGILLKDLIDNDPSCLGMWVTDSREKKLFLAERRCRSLPLDPKFHVPGHILISTGVDRLPWPRLVALIAHECGHAVTREHEFNKRDGHDSEWSSELCADRHAFRWGFEREMRVFAQHRDFGHHAVLPGEIIWQEGIAFKVDRYFYLRRCPDRDDPENLES
ncbi:MAG: hypothetical protein KJ970_04885 [Candidatus Eisenbacteria bacterium]|uniref:Uncharacterized protein n=1 Tax=Eiseniibacteriota bacterium TaxID=2212470 RepID=A0A948RSL3_UNCEI|nr:hypothetical protein [Candidatus Eisenbacteria bacterium]MBU1950218.1 hypothetical protein [Candidatus Eisenbacteria bacterium]MBU2690243.1 hypothetical protein [Candidatus Eisenbacteria bacterium]